MLMLMHLQFANVNRYKRIEKIIKYGDTRFQMDSIDIFKMFLKNEH